MCLLFAPFRCVLFLFLFLLVSFVTFESTFCFHVRLCVGSGFSFISLQVNEMGVG